MQDTKILKIVHSLFYLDEINFISLLINTLSYGHIIQNADIASYLISMILL